MHEQLVAFDRHGVVEILEAASLSIASAGSFFHLQANVNANCGVDINPGSPSNNACYFQPNTFCGSNQVCIEMQTPV